MQPCKQSAVPEITVAIIEPSPALGLGLQTLLERYAPEFRTIGIWPDLVSFREGVSSQSERRGEERRGEERRGEERRPDIILLDTAVIGFSRYVDARELFPDYPQTLLVALTIELIFPGTLASFDGVLHIYDEPEQIVRHLKAIVETSGADNGCDASLTEREREIITAIAKGWSSRRIADELYLSHNTVMTYRKRIASKLGIKGAAEFATYAIRHSLIDRE